MEGKVDESRNEIPKVWPIFQSCPNRFFSPKFGMGNVSDLAKTVLNLQVCGFTPATPRTLFIKVVNAIVVLYK